MCHGIDHSTHLQPENMQTVYLRFEMENQLSANNNKTKKANKI